MRGKTKKYLADTGQQSFLDKMREYLDRDRRVAHIANQSCRTVHTRQVEDVAGDELPNGLGGR
jgi:hypothetical protein